MAFILGVTLQDLEHPKTDLDETLGIYRVHSETMQRHIFHFRSKPENRKSEFSGNPTISSDGIIKNDRIGLLSP